MNHIFHCMLTNKLFMRKNAPSMLHANWSTLYEQTEQFTNLTTHTAPIICRWSRWSLKNVNTVITCARRCHVGTYRLAPENADYRPGPALARFSGREEWSSVTSRTHTVAPAPSLGVTHVGDSLPEIPTYDWRRRLSVTGSPLHRS